FLIDAENADMAGMMMTARIDAAGHFDFELADILLPLEIGEALADPLRNRDRPRIGEIAIVEARAADDVGDEAEIGRRQAVQLEDLPHREKIVLAHMGQNEVLLVAHAD